MFSNNAEFLSKFIRNNAICSEFGGCKMQKCYYRRIPFRLIFLINHENHLIDLIIKNKIEFCVMLITFFKSEAFATERHKHNFFSILM